MGRGAASRVWQFAGWAMDASHEYPDGMIVYNEGTISKAYVEQAIVPKLQSSSCKPTSLPSEEQKPMYVLHWRLPSAAEGDVTYLLLVDRLGGREGTTLHSSTIVSECMAFLGPSPGEVRHHRNDPVLVHLLATRPTARPRLLSALTPHAP